MKEIMLWQSHYYSGHDYCMLENVQDSWRLNGIALLKIEDLPGRLEYIVTCDGDWNTQSASIEGFVGSRKIGIRVEVNKAQDWLINGQPQPELQGCLDIDLGFTPATNTLPIRRLKLGIGDFKTTRAAWLTLPDFNFSLLDQQYSRTDDLTYLYESGNGNYTAVLPVNKAGFVTNYPELWSQESSL